MLSFYRGTERIMDLLLFLKRLKRGNPAPLMPWGDPSTKRKCICEGSEELPWRQESHPLPPPPTTNQPTNQSPTTTERRGRRYKPGNEETKWMLATVTWATRRRGSGLWRVHVWRKYLVWIWTRRKEPPPPPPSPRDTECTSQITDVCVGIFKMRLRETGQILLA